VNTPGKPDLDRLVSALTADGRPDELAGREEAVTAFRTASRGDAADRAASRDAPPRRLRTLPPRLAAAAVVVIILAAGVAAAYTQALPGPAQNLAHTALAPLGVPGNQPPGHPGAETASTSGGRSGPPRTGSSVTPSPPAADTYLLTLTASRIQVPAGTVVEFGGRVTRRGVAAAGAHVRLIERLADTATWQLVASGITGPRGGFRLISPPLAKTAVFRVVGPGAKHSAAVRVTVTAPQVTADAT
jgi:hypothetical protein